MALARFWRGCGHIKATAGAEIVSVTVSTVRQVEGSEGAENIVVSYNGIEIANSHRYEHAKSKQRSRAALTSHTAIHPPSPQAICFST